MIALLLLGICALAVKGLSALPEWLAIPTGATLVSAMAIVLWICVCINQAQYRRIAIPRWMIWFVGVPLITQVWRTFVRPMKYDSIFGKVLVTGVMIVIIISALLEHEIGFVIALVPTWIIGVFLVERHFKRNYAPRENGRTV